MNMRRRKRTGTSGFSLIELLVVLAIMAVMSVVALPAIANFLRTYKIRGAAQQVAGELARARGKAIGTNARNGVLLVTGIGGSDAQYQLWVEDDPDPADATLRPPLPIGSATGAPNGTVMQLPQRIHFAPAAGSTWAGRAIRFSHLGRACATGLTSCSPDPNGTAPATAYINTAPSGTYVGTYTICLIQDNSPLRAIIVVQPGGITRVAQTFTSPCP